MKTLLATLAAALLLGCGGATEAEEAVAIPSGETPTGSVGLPLVADTSLTKIVVRRGVTETVQVVDEEGLVVGTQERFTELFRYVTNIPPTATSLRLPYGSGYTLEVIAGGAPVNGAREILAYYKSARFDVPSVSAPTFNQLDVAPTLRVTSGPVYVGLGAPYDTFKLAVEGLGEPFGTKGWSVLANGVAPRTTSNTTLTFAAPTVDGPLAIEAKFHLTSSILTAGETTSSWVKTVSLPVDPVPSAPVVVVP